MQTASAVQTRAHTSATNDVSRSESSTYDMVPIDEERSRLADWKPETKHTTWGTVGGVGGMIIGGGLGIIPGAAMVMSRDPLIGFIGLGVALGGLVIGGSWGAQAGQSLLHKLDGGLPEGQASKVTSAHQKQVDEYESALDDAEHAIQRADTREEQDQAWGRLMAQRPEDMPIPELPRGTEPLYTTGDYAHYGGFGVVPHTRYGS